MGLGISRFLALLFTALLMGTTLCHVLEMPAKMKLEGAIWMMLQQHLYRSFASVGGFIELAAIVAAGVLTFLSREDHPALELTLLATVCLLVAFVGIWIFVTNKVNLAVAGWTPDSIPAGWMQLRARWEYSHAARFALQLLAFGALAIS
jgi:Domain of unknown function (DUF1772)